MRSLLRAVLGAAVVPAVALAQGPEKQDKRDLLLLEKDQPQVREAARDLPPVAVAEAARLVFLQSPLSAKGLLSEQTSDAVDAVLRQARGAAVVRLRAFVAGTGDTRRVRTIVTEKFTQRRLPLPVLTVLQTGGLPGVGVQIVMEATAVSAREENPRGLGFVSARDEATEGYPMPAAPFVRRAIQKWKQAAAAAGMEGKDVLRVTCFVSALDDYAETRRILAGEFPKAVQNVVQPLRAHAHGLAVCETAARLRTAGPEPLRLLRQFPGGEGGGRAAALVHSGRVALSGSQIGFGFREEDASLAFQRLTRALAEYGASLEDGAWLSIYALSDRMGQEAARIGAESWPGRQAPAATAVTVEDLPALDASFAVDALAVLH